MLGFSWEFVNLIKNQYWRQAQKRDATKSNTNKSKSLININKQYKIDVQKQHNHWGHDTNFTNNGRQPFPRIFEKVKPRTSITHLLCGKSFIISTDTTLKKMESSLYENKFQTEETSTLFSIRALLTSIVYIQKTVPNSTKKSFII